MNEQADIDSLQKNSFDESFEAMVRKFHLPLRAFLIGRIGDATAADDLAQDVLVAAWSDIGGLRNESAFRSWLFTIARNKSVDYIRAKTRRKETCSPNLEDLLAEKEQQGFTENQQLTRALYECLSRLKPHAHAIVKSFYFDNKKSDQIAAEHSMKSSTVRMTLMRIRKVLATCIRENCPEDRDESANI